MSRLAFAALSILVFLIPWDNTVALPGLGSLARLVGAGALGLSIMATLLSGKLRRPQAFHVLAGLFVVWSALTLLWTASFESTLVRTLTYLQVVTLVFLIWEHARTESQQKALIACYVLGACVPALDTIRHYFAGVTIDPSIIRYSATGFNANEVSIILALGIPMAWYLALSTDRPIYRLLNVCYVPLALVAVLLSGSRGAFLGLLVALLLVPWSTGWLSRRARAGLIGLFVVSTCLIYVMVPTASWKRIAQTETEIAGGNFSGRGEIWKSALQVFMDHPVAGFGAGAFEDAASRDRTNINSHQTFLSVLTGQGLVGFSLFVSMLAVACNSIRWMRGLQRRFWIVLCLSLFIALLPRDWDFRKQPWFVLGLLTAQGALTRRMDARMATANPPVSRLHAVPTMGIAREGLRHRPI